VRIGPFVALFLGGVMVALVFVLVIVRSFSGSPQPLAPYAGYTVPPRGKLLAIAKSEGLPTTDKTESPDTPTPTARPEPTPTPVSVRESRRPQREIAQRYWNGIIGSLALAGAAIGFSSEAVQQGDNVTAQRYLTQAEKFADLASQATLNGAPDGWDNISATLYSAANTYKKAIQECKDGFAQGDTEKIADAMDDASSVRTSIDSATHDARIWYQQNGGKWSDLQDYDTVEQSVSTGLKSIVNDSSD